MTQKQRLCAPALLKVIFILIPKERSRVTQILTSKKKPSLNLRGPKLIQLFALCPNPNDLDKTKKSFTTPSGIINPINRDKAVPIIQPNKITIKINIIDLLFIV